MPDFHNFELYVELPTSKAFKRKTTEIIFQVNNEEESTFFSESIDFTHK